jgi:two-component system chemotaxis sensor kinase CheA
MDEREDLLKEFLIESYENLDRLDRDLVELEKDPRNKERLGSIFRAVHTIKGTCGFLGLSKLEAVSHVGENLLSRLRDLELVLNEEITSGLLKLVDALRQVLDSLETSGTEGNADHTELIALLTRLNQNQVAPQVSQVPEAAASAAPAPAPAAPAQSPLAAVSPPPAASTTSPVVPPTLPAAPVASDEERRSGEWGGEERRQGVSDSSLRVDVGLLDKLMNLVGELVLARNQILQFTATHTSSSFVSATGRLNLVTSELQEGVMKTRMQPIGNIWSKFPRIVRDLATTCGKQVRIEMEGKETDLDKTIIEAIKDPLTHVVRNSVDHGIEPPDERIAKGKPAEGRMLLRAFHEGGQINIEISDDGAGINPAKLRDKALQRGLISNEQARAMNDHELIRLVFLPGFSTAEHITNVSGRGVGMDVVKTNIERIGGQVDIQSVLGEGTTLKIKIPLTLAIIPALMVASGGDRYAIPQVSLLELVRLGAEQTRTEIERVNDALFYRLRGNLLPLVYLQRALSVEARGDSEVTNIVVLKAGDRQFGLVVEAIHDTEEIVVKPLGKQLKGVSVFAGATIMGDGNVALILDVLGIAQRAKVVSDARDGARSEARRVESDHAVDVQPLLLFRVGKHERMAIPLNLVARLEEFQPEAIEQSGGREVVQYRDAIMPLVSLSRFFGGAGVVDEGVRQIIVFRDGARNVGLVVDQILDIVSEPMVVQRMSTRKGVLGAAVLQQKVTDLVDVQTIIQASDPATEASAEAA